MALFFRGRDGQSGGGGPQAALQTVRAYWEGLRPGGSGIPARAALDPRGLAPVLDRVFLAESVAPGQLRLRIAGMAVNDLAGSDMKGLPLSLLFCPASREALAGACRTVLDGPAAAEIRAEAERGLARPALSARLLLLPLLSSDGARRLVLGCLATEGAPGRNPRRFAIAQVGITALAEAAPEAAPAAAAEEMAPPHRHLRLVHSV